MKLKGISLSIETIVILIVCVIVLVVTTLFFSGVFNPGAETVGDQSSLSRDCLRWSWHKQDHEHYKDHLKDYPALNKTFGNNPLEAENYCLGTNKEEADVE